MASPLFGFGFCEEKSIKMQKDFVPMMSGTNICIIATIGCQ
jgi:hypothetical protein